MTTKPSKTASSTLSTIEQSKVTARILKDVRDYYDAFGKPCPMKAISAKYARASRGLFYDIMDGLEARGDLTIEIQELTAGRFIYPKNINHKKK